MNREAVALGTPAYTMFAGRLGAVDERLIAEGRLGRAASADDVALKKKGRHTVAGRTPRPAALRRRDPGRGAAAPGPPTARAGAMIEGAGARARAQRDGRPPRPSAPGDPVRERLFISRHRIWQIVIDAGLVALAL